MLCPHCRRRIQAAPYCCYCGQPTGAAERPVTRRRKRSNGSGTVYKVDGLAKPWRARVYKDGRFIQLGYYATLREAQAAVTPENVEAASSVYNYTFGQVWALVCQSAKFQALGQNQQVTLDGAYRRHLAGRIGSQKMRELRPRHYQPILDDLADEGYSESLCTKVLQVISKCTAWAMQNDLISQDYARLLYIDGDKSGERQVFTEGEIRTLFAHQGTRDVDIILVLIGTGMRPADLVKIRRDDAIDVDGHCLLLAGSKTKAGRGRPLYINSAVWPIFLRYYLAAAPGGYVFPSPAGKQLSLHNYRVREFYPALARLGIMPNPYRPDGSRVDDVPPRLVPYSCRHTFFTLAAQSGVRKDVMQRTGGHAIGSDITDRVYIHRAAQDMAAELDKLGDKLHQMGG